MNSFELDEKLSESAILRIKQYYDNEPIVILNFPDKNIYGFGCEKKFYCEKNKEFWNKFQYFLDENNTKWILGYFSYDLKNYINNEIDILELSSENNDYLSFPEYFFIIPKILIVDDNNTTTKIYLSNSKYKLIFDKLNNTNNETTHLNKIKLPQNYHFNSRLNKKAYLSKIDQIKSELEKGNIYEINFSYEKFIDKIVIDGYDTFVNIQRKIKAPFASYIKIDNKSEILSFSPERFLQKLKNEIISQPIKGTISRNKDYNKDLINIKKLIQSKKDISENIMTVDLVRNDMSKIADKNSVEVLELCKLYTFNNIHQLISTIKCKVDKKIHNLEIIKSLFPAASMTGVPKLNALKIIEKLENTKRGLYSGNIGYFNPYNEFDFNVVIRTLLYKNKKLTINVGGAITLESNKNEEYSETITKTESILKFLEDETFKYISDN